MKGNKTSDDKKNTSIKIQEKKAEVKKEGALDQIDKNLHSSQLDYMDYFEKEPKLKYLSIINCNIDIFLPKKLSYYLEYLNLEANRLDDKVFQKLQFSSVNEVPDKKEEDNGRKMFNVYKYGFYNLQEIKLS